MKNNRLMTAVHRRQTGNLQAGVAKRLRKLGTRVAGGQPLAKGASAASR